MNAVKVFNLQGKEVKQIDLNPNIFGVEINKDLIHQAMVSQLANGRHVLAHTKTRADVRGGGRKPWRQKGTGRARHGSTRSPIWKGGGVTFGPSKDRNFSQKINKKMKRKALFSGLSARVSDNGVVLVDQMSWGEEAKTKKMLEALKNLNLADKKVLVVLPEANNVIRLAARNLSNVTVILADSLNIIDVLNHEVLLMPVDSLGIIEKVYLK